MSAYRPWQNMPTKGTGDAARPRMYTIVVVVRSSKDYFVSVF